MMAIVTTLLLLAAFLAPLALVLLSRSDRFGPLAGSAFHPFAVAGFVLFVMALDLAAAEASIRSGVALSFAGHDRLDPLAMVEGLGRQAVMATALVLGVALACRGATPAPSAVDGDAARRRAVASRFVFAVALAAATAASGVILVAGLARGDLFLIAGARQVYLRDNLLQTVALLTLMPAFILFAGHHAQRMVPLLLTALAAIVVMLPTGSRVTLLYLALAAATALAPRLRLPALAAYAAAPLVVLLLLYLRFLRSGATTGFATFVEAQGQRLVFAGPDLTFAEALILLDPAAVPRWPGESLLAMAVAPLPRALIPWKPEGASTVMTRLADPQRWDATKSEWLTTGFVNLIVEVGPVLAPILMTALAYVWARALMRVSAAPWPAIALRSTILSVTAVQFLRTDLYNLSLFLWAMAGVALMARLAGALLRRSAPPAASGRTG